MNNSWNNPQFQQQQGQVGQVKLFDPTQFQTPAASVPNPAAASKQPQAHVTQTTQNQGGANFQPHTAHQNDSSGFNSHVATTVAPGAQPYHSSWSSWGNWDNWNGATNDQQQQQQSQQQSYQPQYPDNAQTQSNVPHFQQGIPDSNVATTDSAAYNNAPVYNNSWDSSWDGASGTYAQPNQIYQDPGYAMQPEQHQQQQQQNYYGQTYQQPSYLSGTGGGQVQSQQPASGHVAAQQDPNLSDQTHSQAYQQQSQAPQQEGQSFADGGQQQVFYDQPSIPHGGYDSSNFTDSGPLLGQATCGVTQNQHQVPVVADTNSAGSHHVPDAEASSLHYNNNMPSLNQPFDQSMHPSSNASGDAGENAMQIGYAAPSSHHVEPSLATAPNLDIYSDNDGDGTVAGFFGRGDDDGDVSSDLPRSNKPGPMSEIYPNQESQGNLLDVAKPFDRTNSEISNSSLMTLNTSTGEDDGREHLQNLQELVQRMENVNIMNRDIGDVNDDGLAQPPSLPLDTELRSASPDIGLPESAESGGSGVSGGSSGLTDWEIVPPQSQMTHSRSNSLDNGVNVFSPDNQDDKPPIAGEIKDGGVDMSIPQLSGAAVDESVPQALLPQPPSTTSSSHDLSQSLSPEKTPSLSPSSKPPLPLSGSSDAIDNPFRKSAPLSNSQSSSATMSASSLPVLSRNSQPNVDPASDSSSFKPKSSIPSLPSKPKLPSDDGAPPIKNEAAFSKPSLPLSDNATAKKISKPSEKDSLSSQRRHHSAFQPVHRVRQNTVSPATTLWENSDNPAPSSNILLAPAMPLIIPALNPYSSSAAATATTNSATTSSDMKKSGSSSSLSDKAKGRREQEDMVIF